VEDNGIGLSPEMMANLFRPFKQAQRMTGGTGLGLYSLAKRLHCISYYFVSSFYTAPFSRIEALNGCYGVSNRHDGEQGCLFWFEIPYRPDEDSASRWKRKDTEVLLHQTNMAPESKDDTIVKKRDSL